MDPVGQVLEEEALKATPPLDEVTLDVSFHGHSSWFQLHYVTEKKTLNKRASGIKSLFSLIIPGYILSQGGRHGSGGIKQLVE